MSCLSVCADSSNVPSPALLPFQFDADADPDADADADRDADGNCGCQCQRTSSSCTSVSVSCSSLGRPPPPPLQQHQLPLQQTRAQNSTSGTPTHAHTHARPHAHTHAHQYGPEVELHFQYPPDLTLVSNSNLRPPAQLASSAPVPVPSTFSATCTDASSNASASAGYMPQQQQQQLHMSSEAGSLQSGYYSFPSNPRTPDSFGMQRAGAPASVPPASLASSHELDARPLEQHATGAKAEPDEAEAEAEAVFLPHPSGNALPQDDLSACKAAVVKRRHEQRLDLPPGNDNDNALQRVSPAEQQAQPACAPSDPSRHSGQSDDSTPTASASNSARNTMQSAAVSDRSSGATLSLLVAGSSTDDTLNM